jgi:hypothetical protein
LSACVQGTQDEEQHGNSKKDNPEKLATQGTQDEEQYWNSRKENPEKLATASFSGFSFFECP